MQQQAQELKQQIVVITGENVIEEGVVVEQHQQPQQIQERESEPNQVQAQPQVVHTQRLRKQQLETINTDIEPEQIGNGEAETVTKTRKKAETLTPSVRPTRAAASKTAAIQEETVEEEEIEAEEQQQQQQQQQEEQQDANVTPVKRGRGRPPKGAKPAVEPMQQPTQRSSEDESSPQRKSARIASKYVPFLPVAVNNINFTPESYNLYSSFYYKI